MTKVFNLRSSRLLKVVLSCVATLLVTGVSGMSLADSIFRVESSVGDPLGNGQTYERTMPATSFIGSCDPTSATVRMVTGSLSSEFKISSASGLPLLPDVYAGATRRSSVQGVTPELAVALDQTACTVVYGYFVLRSFTCSPAGQITDIAVDALQHCQTPDAPPLKVFLRMDSSVPVKVPHPTAIAGQDIAATEGEVVTLDGSNSYAPGGITSVHWQQISGPAIVITDGATLHPKFYAPEVPPGGATVVLEIAVTGSDGSVSRDQVKVFVRAVSDPRKFVAITGLPGNPQRQLITDLDAIIAGSCTSKEVSIGVSRQQPSTGFDLLSADNASLISDIYEDLVPVSRRSTLMPSFSFTGNEGCNLPVGRVVVREFDCSVDNTITKLAFDSEHYCSFPRRPPIKAVVRFNSSIPDEVPQPTAAAGADQVATEGDPVQLDGSRSYAPNGIAGVAWQQVSGPAVTLSDATSLKPRFVAPSVVSGGESVVMEIQVTGNNGLVNSDRVVINVRNQTDPRYQLTIVSKAGSYVGGGVTQMFSRRDSSIFSSCSANAVYVSLRGYEGWSVNLAAPNGASLATTTYENAQRYPFQSSSSPGMNVSGGGAGCNQLTGRFDVREYSCNPDGTLLRLAADMEQACVGTPSPVSAFIRMNSAVPIPDIVDRGCRFDVDANGATSAADDGPILLRALGGFIGEALETPRPAFNALRSHYWQLEPYFENSCGILPRPFGAGGCSLDLDCDGKIQLSTDGVIATRLMAGLTGNAVLANATAASATRTTWAELAPYLSACKLLPSP